MNILSINYNSEYIYFFTQIWKIRNPKEVKNRPNFKRFTAGLLLFQNKDLQTKLSNENMFIWINDGSSIKFEFLNRHQFYNNKNRHARRACVYR